MSPPLPWLSVPPSNSPKGPWRHMGDTRSGKTLQRNSDFSLLRVSFALFWLCLKLAVLFRLTGKLTESFAKTFALQLPSWQHKRAEGKGGTLPSPGCGHRLTALLVPALVCWGGGHGRPLSLVRFGQATKNIHETTFSDLV